MFLGVHGSQQSSYGMKGHGSQGAQEQRADLRPGPCMAASSAGVNGGGPSTGSISVRQTPAHLLFLPDLGAARLVLAGFASWGSPEAGEPLGPRSEQG